MSSEVIKSQQFGHLRTGIFREPDDEIPRARETPIHPLLLEL
jgi:hypothetical protein